METKTTPKAGAGSSRIPKVAAPAGATRKTRVSDLISRLSSSTASSRAKTDSNISRLAGMFRSRHSTGGTVTTTTSPPRSRLPAVSGALPAAGTGGVTGGQRTRPVSRQRHVKAPRPSSTDSESSIFFPKVGPSNVVQRPRDSQIPASPFLPSTPRRPNSMTRRHSELVTTASSGVSASATPVANKRASYHPTSAPKDPPTAPPPQLSPRKPTPGGFSSVRNSTGGGGRSATASPMPATRPVSRIRARRPASRASMAKSQQAQMRQLRMEELKFKISELEDVLQQERVEREAVLSQQEHIAELETLLERERREKELLALKLKQTGVSDTNTTPVSGLESPSMSESEHESSSSPRTGSDAEQEKQVQMQRYQERIAELEKRLSMHTDSESNADGAADLVVLQTEVSMLRNDNKALAAEKLNLQGLLRERDTELRALREKVETVESQHADLRVKLQAASSAAAEANERASHADKTITQKNTQIEEQRAEILRLSTSLATVEASLREEQRLLDEARDEAEKAKTDRDELNRQVQAFQVGRKQLDKQMAVLERENRRSKRLIIALETSLQDLKISLEEKAMENDELNRSILKVMEQANETIEGAKRHSMVVTSPPLNGHSSPDGSRSSRASIGDKLFPITTGGSSNTSPR